VIFLHPKDCGGVLVELEQAWFIIMRNLINWPKQPLSILSDVLCYYFHYFKTLMAERLKYMHMYIHSCICYLNLDEILITKYLTLLKSYS
jgi:hypothetical protein